MWKSHNCPEYILGLMPGLEDDSLMGYVYNCAERVKFIAISHPYHGVVLYSEEHNMFWQAGPSSRANLDKMHFGIDSGSGLIVPGTQADETTLEAGFTLLDRAPYGARKFLNEFFA